jgi:hypothetical protein
MTEIGRGQDDNSLGKEIYGKILDEEVPYVPIIREGREELIVDHRSRPEWAKKRDLAMQIAGQEASPASRRMDQGLRLGPMTAIASVDPIESGVV